MLRDANRIKGLVWEGDGFLLLSKRVEDGRFYWPRNSSEAIAFRPHQFTWLMQGFAVELVIKDVRPLKST